MRCIYLGTSPLLFALACLVASPLRAEIIITEIMYNPQGSDQETGINREWAELYNTGSLPVSLTGWQFGDAQDNTWANPFPAGTTIGAHQALIVTGDATSFDLEWGAGINRVQVGAFPTLANSPSPTNETAAIRDNLGVTRDAVNFDQNFNQPNGWPKINGDDGQSIFLRPQGLTSTANDNGANWKPSMWDVYGAQFRTDDGENHGSPGFVATVPQAPFTPLPDTAWSMVIMPDTQNYVKWGEYQPLLPEITTWIRDHKDEFKIQVVLQEGDIVNNNNTISPPIPPSSGDQDSASQWAAAQAGMFVLNGHVPYILAAGNHDHGTTNAQNRSSMINNYFQPSDNPLNDPAQGGILKGQMNAGEIQNAYYAFTAPDGRNMLIFSLEWEPRPATVTWANQIAALPQYADHTAVLLTHNYLTPNDTRSTSTNVAADYSGEELWQGLVRQHENFELVFNGHFGGEGAGYLQSTGNAGNDVHQLFYNTQFETLGGDGWIRLVEFLDDGETVRVRTYSPYHDLARLSAANQFEFEISPLPPPPPVVGDYNGNDIVDAADYPVWRKTVGTSWLIADGFADGQVNERDYFVWWNRFGETNLGSSPSNALVPEPTGLTGLLACAWLLFLHTRLHSRPLF